MNDVGWEITPLGYIVFIIVGGFIIYSVIKLIRINTKENKNGINNN